MAINPLIQELEAYDRLESFEVVSPESEKTSVSIRNRGQVYIPLRVAEQGGYDGEEYARLYTSVVTDTLALQFTNDDRDKLAYKIFHDPGPAVTCMKAFNRFKLSEGLQQLPGSTLCPAVWQGDEDNTLIIDLSPVREAIDG